MNVELHTSAIEIITSQFNIKLAMDCRKFDNNLDVLIDQLLKFQNTFFEAKDKILLVHMDTDYYDPLLPCGSIPINLIRIFKNLDLPLHALLFVTNHFGIGQEFDLLLKDHHPADQPMVVETLLSPILLNDHYSSSIDLSLGSIEKPAICMMNQARSHRVAFYNFLLDNNLLDKVAVSQHFNA